MTPAALARLHARCFTLPRPYGAAEFTDLLASEAVFLCHRRLGFALGRAAADEAELITLAVDPDRRRCGLGRALLDAFEAEAVRRGAATAFLEVAATNAGALALYRSAGYAETGRRRGYYRAASEPAVDAILLSKPLGAG